MTLTLQCHAYKLRSWLLFLCIPWPIKCKKQTKNHRCSMYTTRDRKGHFLRSRKRACTLNSKVTWTGHALKIVALFAPYKVAKIYKKILSATSKDLWDRDDFLRGGKNLLPYTINVVKIRYTLWVFITHLWLQKRIWQSGLADKILHKLLIQYLWNSRTLHLDLALCRLANIWKNLAVLRPIHFWHKGSVSCGNMEEWHGNVRSYIELCRIKE